MAELCCFFSGIELPSASRSLSISVNGPFAAERLRTSTEWKVHKRSSLTKWRTARLQRTRICGDVELINVFCKQKPVQCRVELLTDKGYDVWLIKLITQFRLYGGYLRAEKNIFEFTTWTSNSNCLMIINQPTLCKAHRQNMLRLGDLKQSSSFLDKLQSEKHTSPQAARTNAALEGYLHLIRCYIHNFHFHNGDIWRYLKFIGNVTYPRYQTQSFTLQLQAQHMKIKDMWRGQPMTEELRTWRTWSFLVCQILAWAIQGYPGFQSWYVKPINSLESHQSWSNSCSSWKPYNDKIVIPIYWLPHALQQLPPTCRKKFLVCVARPEQGEPHQNLLRFVETVLVKVQGSVSWIEQELTARIFTVFAKDLETGDLEKKVICNQLDEFSSTLRNFPALIPVVFVQQVVYKKSQVPSTQNLSVSKAHWSSRSRISFLIRCTNASPRWRAWRLDDECW